MSLLDPRRTGRGLHWSILAFLLAFAIVLALVGYGFLIPAVDAARTVRTTTQSASQPAATQNAREDLARLAAVSRLLLAVVLVVLAGTLILTFRTGRFFLPRPLSKRTQTRYTDAWAEAGRRMELPPDDDANDPPPDKGPS